MAKIAATHEGTCQICGRKQKLPSGRLSLHGYTVQWGFFNGTCCGSQAPAYEESCDLLKTTVLRQTEIVEGMKKALDNNFPVISDPETVMMARIPFKANNDRYRTVYKIVAAKATIVTKSPFEGRWIMTPVEEVSGFVFSPSISYSAPRDALTLLNEVQENNREQVRREIAQRLSWIEWAKQRVAEWKPMPLIPLFETETGTARELNKFEASLMKEIREYLATHPTYKMSDRSSYVVKHTVSYNRIRKLVADGFLKMVDSGYNRDGNWIEVALA